MHRLLTLFFLAFAVSTSALAQETRMHWFGHAAFSITTPKGKVLLIDPWLKNPKNPEKDPLSAIEKADYILLTHGHGDHVGDAVAIAKKTGAMLVANNELAANLARLTGFPPKQAEGETIMGIGGEIVVADGEVTIAMTSAVHSSSVLDPNAGANAPDRAYGGNPAGFVVIIANGPTIYHSGDTAYFKDMETVGESYAIDVALLNIGGHYGMEPKMAAKAAESLRAKVAVPHHFGTFPGIAQTAEVFASELARRKLRFHEMKPGQTLTFRGREIVKAKPN